MGMAMTRDTDMRAVMTKDTNMAMTTTITGMTMDTVMDMDMMTTTDTKGRDTLIITHMVTSTGRMVTNTAKMDILIITMGTGAILREDILITIMGMAEITTMVTGRTTIMGMEITQRKVTWITMTSTRRKATTMAATTTTTTVLLQRRENRRKNKVRAPLLLMAAANKEGTNSKRGYTSSSAGLNRAIMSVCAYCIIGNNTTTHWAPVDTTLHSVGAGVAFNLL